MRKIILWPVVHENNFLTMPILVALAHYVHEAGEVLGPCALQIVPHTVGKDKAMMRGNLNLYPLPRCKDGQGERIRLKKFEGLPTGNLQWHSRRTVMRRGI